MPLPKGASLFYRSSKKRWILSYADPIRGQPQKVLPKEIIPRMQEHTFFYVWDESISESASEVRWMTSFDTTEEDVRGFARRLRELVGG